MRYKLRKKNVCITAAILIVVIAVCVITFKLLTASPIHFVKGPYLVEVNSEVDWMSFVKDVSKGNISDVVVDSSQVDSKTLGRYNVVYQWKDKKKTLKVEVVDTQAPQLTLKSIKIAKNQALKAEDLVESVKDETKVTLSLDKEYSFDQLGTQEVSVKAQDEGKNETIEKTTVEVVEDKQAPVIVGSHFSVVVGSDVDFNQYVTIQDDYDKNPTVTIDKGSFDNQTPGEYKIKYTAKDFSGNQSEKEIIAYVVKKGEEVKKVVYLTFDDGPSKYTPDVLDILDKYNAKATFFITGMNEKYRKYIGIANEKGHTIGLHTYSHNYSKVYSSVDAYFDDLTKVGNLAKEYIGYVPKYIRFPGGGSNTISKKYTKGIMTQLTKMVEEKGYVYYDWNAENGDGYSKISKSEMLKRATASSQDKIMILMHDANGKQNTVDILPEVIEYYQKKGYVFKAIDDSTFVPHQKVNN